LCLADSIRYVAVLTTRAIRQVSERLLPVTEDEEAWTFSNIIAPVWDAPASDLLRMPDLLRALEQWPPATSYARVSRLAGYTLTVVSDISALSGAGGGVPLSSYFGPTRHELFPTLRRRALSLRLDASAASDSADAAAAAARILSSPTLPPNAPACCSLLANRGRHRELIDCVLRWSRSVPPDDSLSSLADRVLSLLRPTFAAARSPGAARSALASALADGRNEDLRRAALRYCEAEGGWEAAVALEFPGMLDMLRDGRSPLFARVRMARGAPAERFRAHVEAARSPAPLPVDERVAHLRRARDLCPGDARVERALAVADALRPVAAAMPELFADEPEEAVRRLVRAGEARVALAVCAAAGIRSGDALAAFVASAAVEELREYVGSGGVFSEADVAEALFAGGGGVRAVMRAGIACRAVFAVARRMRGRERSAEAEALVELIEQWDPVEIELREAAADFYCELVVELDAEGKDELAERIRFVLGKCFIDQRFTDEWDVV
jgi:hypothetical protein